MDKNRVDHDTKEFATVAYPKTTYVDYIALKRHQLLIKTDKRINT